MTATNTTAMVLGYWVLTLFLVGTLWFIAVRLEAWRYKRARQRGHDRDWDNVRSAWLFEQNQDRYETLEIPFIDVDRVDTDVHDFNNIVERFYDYQEDHKHDVA